ncbi:MAG: head-tail connector protein [Chloroflexota bacterium]
MGAIAVITGPAVEPVTLFEAKVHLRVTTDDEDVLLAALIRAARVRCEQHTRRAFVTQTIRYTTDEMPEFDGDWVTSERSVWADVELPRPPFRELVAVSYATDTTDAIPLTPGSYRMSLGGEEPSRLMLRGPFIQTLPREFDALTVEYTAGYGDRGIDVPDPIRQAVLVTVASMYEDREGGQIPTGQTAGDVALPALARQLLAGYRVVYL